MARLHKYSNNPLYGVWNNLKNRCTLSNLKDWKTYGGKGISYDSRWESFENFKDDMSPTYKAGLSLDRIDNDKGYSKENCRWATQKEQSNNVRRNIIIELNGKRRPLYWWSEKLNIKSHTIYTRIIRGWSASDSLKPLWGKQNDSV